MFSQTTVGTDLQQQQEHIQVTRSRTDCLPFNPAAGLNASQHVHLGYNVGQKVGHSVGQKVGHNVGHNVSQKVGQNVEIALNTSPAASNSAFLSLLPSCSFNFIPPNPLQA